MSGQWLQSGLIASFDMSKHKGVFSPGGAKEMEGAVFCLTMKAVAPSAEPKNIRIRLIAKNGADTVIDEAVTKSIIVSCESHSFGDYISQTDCHHRVCTACGHKQEASHVWDSGTVAQKPTCTTQGTKAYTCTVCGGEKTESLAAEGHSASDWIIQRQPAVDVPGSQYIECTACKQILQTETIPALEPEEKPTEPAPTEPEVQPTEPAPTEPEVQPTEPAPTEPEVQPTEPAPTEPEVQPTEPAPTEPEVQPTEPAPTEPEVLPTEPVPTEPEVQPTEPTPTEPEVQPTEPVPTEPEVQPTEPVPTEPEVQPTEPAPTEPEVQPTEPAPTEPEVQPTEPAPTESEMQPTEPAPTEPEATPAEPAGTGSSEKSFGAARILACVSAACLIAGALVIFLIKRKMGI